MSTRRPNRRPASHSPSAKRRVTTAVELPSADEQDLLQIRDRLEWTPEDRLRHLRDMIAFEDLARTARRV